MAPKVAAIHKKILSGFISMDFLMWWRSSDLFVQCTLISWSPEPPHVRLHSNKECFLNTIPTLYMHEYY